MSSGKERIVLELPKDLYEKIASEAKDAGFDKVEEFIVYVLEQLVESSEVGEEMSKEDEEKVKERLRALGYID